MLDIWLLSLSTSLNGNSGEKDNIMTSIGYICWNIWKMQCKVAIKLHLLALTVVIRESHAACWSYLTAQASKKTSRKPPHLEKHFHEMGISLFCYPRSITGHTRVVIESDSKEAMSCLICSIPQGKWQLYPSLCNIRNSCSNFRECNWSLVPRTANWQPIT
ncbi:unnamed protein product [Prunus brigantina]